MKDRADHAIHAGVARAPKIVQIQERHDHQRIGVRLDLFADPVGVDSLHVVGIGLGRGDKRIGVREFHDQRPGFVAIVCFGHAKEVVNVDRAYAFVDVINSAGRKLLPHAANVRQSSQDIWVDAHDIQRLDNRLALLAGGGGEIILRCLMGGEIIVGLVGAIEIAQFVFENGQQFRLRNGLGRRLGVRELGQDANKTNATAEAQRRGEERGGRRKLVDLFFSALSPRFRVSAVAFQL